MAGGIENDYIETFTLEGDSKSKNMIALENIIEVAKNMKKTLNSAMDSVISLMREVEHKEKLAEQAVEDIGKTSLDILAKVEEIKQARSKANETNQTFAKEIYAERDAFYTAMDMLQIGVADYMVIGDSSASDLDEIRRALEIRLTSALIKKEEAEKDSLNMEVSARKALAYEEREMEKVVQESKRLKKEAVKNSKIRQFIVHHGHEYNTLREEMPCKDELVNQIKEKLDHTVVLSDILSSCQPSCEPQSDIENSKCLKEPSAC